MRDIRGENTSAEAEVRRALAAYQAVRRRLADLGRNEPNLDEPIEVQEDFELRARAMLRAEQIAHDALLNAVASFAARSVQSSFNLRAVRRTSRISEKPDGQRGDRRRPRACQ